MVLQWDVTIPELTEKKPGMPIFTCRSPMTMNPTDATPYFICLTVTMYF